jgi:hypothetical protein
MGTRRNLTKRRCATFVSFVVDILVLFLDELYA